MPKALVSLALMLCLLGLLSACTPSYTRESTESVARDLRLMDDVDIQRGHRRLISRRAQLCLVSGEDLAERNETLGLAQEALARHFAAVGVERYSMSYLEMVEVLPCPGADYLLYLEPLCRAATGVVCETGAPLLAKVVQRTDAALFDQVALHMQGGWWRLGVISRAQRYSVFDQLGRALVGE